MLIENEITRRSMIERARVCSIMQCGCCTQGRNATVVSCNSSQLFKEEKHELISRMLSRRNARKPTVRLCRSLILCRIRPKSQFRFRSKIRISISVSDFKKQLFDFNCYSLIKLKTICKLWCDPNNNCDLISLKVEDTTRDTILLYYFS